MKGGVVGFLTWDNCDSCRHSDDATGACELESETDFTVDAFSEEVICDNYEEK